MFSFGFFGNHLYKLHRLKATLTNASEDLLSRHWRDFVDVTLNNEEVSEAVKYNLCEVIFRSIFFFNVKEFFSFIYGDFLLRTD